MIHHCRLFLIVCSIAFFSISCKGRYPIFTPTGTDSIISVFKVSPDSVKFDKLGGNDTLKVRMNGKGWTVLSNRDWCTVSKTGSASDSDQVIVSASANSTGLARTASLSFVMDQKKLITVIISQSVGGSLYPDYSSPTIPDSTGMSENARLLVHQIFAGWNLGNALEVPGNETGWGNPKTTQTLIDSIKATGINAIRIPCAWDSYIENAATCKLKDSWLQRVKQVVDYCYKNNMFVIINIHWDGGWLENNPTYAKQEAVNAKQKALWEQIAVYFRNYDDHLMFAGTNEVHVDYNTPSAENISVQQSYNQTFVDAVRSTGGRNAYRNLIIQSYNTNIGYAISYLKVPVDKIMNKLLVEVHYYDPWDFCGDNASNIYLWGKAFAQFGSISSWGQEDGLNEQFKSMKTNFVDKGFPVILGEFGAIRRSLLAGTTLSNHLASRAYYFEYLAQQAKTYGIVPFVWDNGNTGNNGMAMFYRSTGAVFDHQALNAYLAGASKGIYPF